MPAPLVTVTPGEVFAVPLFVSDEPENKRFGVHAFEGRGDEFSYLRVIKDMRGAGILVEVFAGVGPLDASIERVVATGRLFRPVAIAGLGIYKKRWRSIGVTPNYDAERDSGYSQIQFVSGPRREPLLWQAGEETPLSYEASKAYEDWTVWFADDLEKRIIAALSE